jgi:hypothetical protein
MVILPRLFLCVETERSARILRGQLKFAPAISGTEKVPRSKLTALLQEMPMRHAASSFR